MAFEFISDNRWNDLEEEERIGMMEVSFDREIASDPRWSDLSPEEQDGMWSEYIIRAQDFESELRAPPEERSSLASVGTGLAAGGIGILSSVGTGIQWAGNRLGLDEVAAFGEERAATFDRAAEPYGPSKDIAGKNVWDNPELLANSTYWLYNVANMVPFLASAAVPGAIAYKGIKAITAIPKLAKIGAAVVGGGFGGAMEGSQTYKAVLESGGTEEEAARAGELMSAGSGVLNALGFGGILAKAGNSFKGRVIKHLGAAAWEGLTEGLEEPTEVFSKYFGAHLAGQPLPTDLKEQLIESAKDALTVAPVAAVTGGGASILAGTDKILDAPTVDDAIRESEAIIEETLGAPGPSIYEDPTNTLLGNLESKGFTFPEMGGAAVAQLFRDYDEVKATTDFFVQVERDKRAAELGAHKRTYGVEIDEERVREEVERRAEPSIDRDIWKTPKVELTGRFDKELHPVSIKRAIAKGEFVPADVLKDYPDIVAPDDIVEAPSALAAEIDTLANEAATSPENDLPDPTEAQIEAGNYKHGHIQVQGIDIAIENPAGSERSGTDEAGNPWSVTMDNHYGYINRSTGKDSEQIDVIVGPDVESEMAYVVDQTVPETGAFDEHKVVLGALDIESARETYLANYEEGWQGLGEITEVPIDEFKEWVGDGTRKTDPFSPSFDVAKQELPPEGEIAPTEVAVEEPAVEKAEPDQIQVTDDGEIGSPLTKMEKSLKEYQEYVASLTKEEMAKAGDLIVETPGAPSSLKLSIQKALSAKPEAEKPKPTPRVDTKKDKAVSKLRSVAEKTRAKAQESFDADRQENTNKRAEQAASTRAAAAKDIAIAETMVKIADGLESGDLKALSAVSAKAHVEQLDRILTQAQYTRHSSLYDSYSEKQQHKGEPITSEDVEFAKYPDIFTHPDQVRRGKETLGTVRGGKKLARTFNQRTDYDDAKAIVAFAKKAPGERGRKLIDDMPWSLEESTKNVGRMKRLGLNNIKDLKAALSELVELRSETKKEDPVKAMERDLLGTKIPGFFPTRKPVVDRMILEAEIEDGMTVLEPSAGIGNIADGIKEEGVDPDVIEISGSLRPILEAKGFNVVGSDFMEFDGKYDRIIMNPPFEKGQDVDHVRHAYELLNPGGRIVSIMGEHPFFASDSKSEEFREWLDDVGTSEKLPEGSFKGKEALRETGVNARMVVIDKSDSEAAPEEQYSIKPGAAGITLKDVQQLFKGQNVGLSDDGSIWVRTKGGKGLQINLVKHIEPNSTVFEVSYGRVPKNKMSGKYKAGEISINRDIGDKWTLAHESEHWLEDVGIITQKETEVLRSYIRRQEKAGKFTTINKGDIGGLEDRAQFISDNLHARESVSSPIRRILQKIADLFDGLVNLVTRTSRGIVTDIESGKIFERESAKSPIGETQFQEAGAAVLPMPRQDPIEDEPVTFQETTEPVTVDDYEENRLTDQNVKAKALLAIKNFGSQISSETGKLLAPISTRLANIDKTLSAKVRQLDFDTNRMTQSDVDSALPLLKKAKKMSRNDAADWDYARKNSDVPKLNELVAKYDMRTEYRAYRRMLDGLRKDAIDVGLRVGEIDEYAPRIVKDLKGLLGEMGLEQKSRYETALQDRARELGIAVAEMPEDMRATIITSVILGTQRGLGGPAATKERKFEKIPARLNKYYLHSDAALMAHINGMRDAIEKRKFFGKIPQKVAKIRTHRNTALAKVREYNEKMGVATTEGAREKARKKRNDWIGEEKMSSAYLEKYALQRDFSEDISSHIDGLINRGDIAAEDFDTANEILQARFHEKGPQGFFQAYKNLAYIDTMGSPISALTQFGDLAWSMYNSGVFKTLKYAGKSALPKRYKDLKITREDVGAARIAQEFADPGTLGKAVSQVFKMVGLEKIDAIGKEALLNSALDVYQKQARENPDKLKREISHIFEGETDGVIMDLVNDEITDDVKLLVYNRLVDFQPVGLSEVPQRYLSSANGRIFYMLKTFTIKQFDVFRNEAFSKIRTGNKAEKIQGLKNLVSLSMFFVLANAGADELKDLVLGRKTDMSDRLADNILRLAGSSKYMTWKARTEGIGTAAAMQVLPPFKWLNSAYKDIRTMGDDKGLELTASIPLLGKLAYWHLGRGTSKRDDLWDRRFRKHKARLKKIKERHDRSKNKAAYSRDNLKDLLEYKRANKFQGKLNKSRRVINELTSREETPTILKRIKQVENRRTEMIKQYLKQRR